MDIPAVVGTFLSVSLVLMGILIQGVGFGIYINVPGFCITILGGIMSAMAGFSLADVSSLPRVLRKCYTIEQQPFLSLISNLVRFAEIARRDGILALEQVMESVEDRFLKRGLQLAVDGTDPELIHQLLDMELDQIHQRHEKFKRMIDAMAHNLPSFGMVGTLIGLVGMMIHLDDPKKIGHAMSVGLLATLYGVAGCYIVLAPLAIKLENKSKDENRMKEMIISGVLSIQSGDNPRVVEQKLRIFLPPALRNVDIKQARRG